MGEQPARRRVRWTEHGPEEYDADPAAGDPAAGGPAPVADPVEEAATVRARLEARGLLRTEPAVRIRDVVGPRPAVAPSEPPTPVAPDSGRVEDEDEDDGGAEALEPDPGGTTAAVRCRSCRSMEPVSIAATGYRCRSCARVWRWAVCPSCNELDLTFARQESWRCTSCGTGTRSWWRTANAPNESVAVVERKRLEAGRIRRRRALDFGRRYRTVIVASVVTLAIAVTAAVTVPRLAADDRATEGASATCADFRTLQADLDRNSIPPAALRSRLDALAAGAAEADDAVRIGAERLAASGRPGDQAFEEAKARLDRLCPR